jgi:hypothetical protein
MTQQASIASMHQGGPSGWWATYLGHRYAVLFYSLLLTLVGAPILKAIGMPGTGMQVFLGLNLLAAALPADSRKGRWVLPAILLVAVVLRIVSLQAGYAALGIVSLVLWTLIALYAVFGALRFSLRSTVITSEHLYAALSAYLLVGCSWACCTLVRCRCGRTRSSSAGGRIPPVFAAERHLLQLHHACHCWLR